MCSSIHGVIWSISHSLEMDDSDFLGLPNPVSSGNSLLLVLGVRVRIIHHHCVSCLQVQAPAGSSDAQQKDEDLAVWGVELLDGDLPARRKPFSKQRMPDSTHKHHRSCGVSIAYVLINTTSTATTYRSYAHGHCNAEPGAALQARRL